jgi:phthiocerol/phenolphthiocerol synthesis type-I polyketide synthase E
VIFLFPGQGTQYPLMAHDLYRGNKVFREAFEACARIIGPIGGRDSLIDIIFDASGGSEAVLRRTEISQPAIFSVEYALCRLWESLGVKPAAVVGHSSGEYAAACEAGVMSVEDALALIRERGRLMQSMEPGTMIAVSMPEPEVRKLLPASLDIAVINAPAICEISGPTEEVRLFAESLEKRGIPSRALHTSHAFHSRMMEKAVAPFTAAARKIHFSPPRIPIASNLTGTWMRDADATDPVYWSRHLRNTVRFSDDLEEAARRFDGAVLLEVGPGNTSCSIARQQAGPAAQLAAVPSIRHPQQNIDDEAFLSRALGALWCNGVSVNPDMKRLTEARRRVVIPGYPFERHFLLQEPRLRKTKTSRRGRRDGGGLKRERRTPEKKRGSITLDDLIDIWKKVLGEDTIGPDDNFFELGGHSLLAVGLANRIEKAFGRRLPLAALLDSPTPRRNFDLLTGAAHAGGSRLCVPIAPGGTRTPFFLFHSHGGNVLEYYRLATLIAKDRPVYAIQCRGVDGSPLMPVPIEEMARTYLNEIRAIQPDGPYLLGGYCFGGILAVEAALQLQASGQATAIVVMINSVTRDYPANIPESIGGAKRMQRRILDRAGLEWSNLGGKPFAQKIQQIGIRIGRILSLASVRAEKTATAFRSRMGRGPRKHSLAYHLEEIAKNNDDAWLEYQPKPYAGKVLFFRATRQPRDIAPDPMLGWKGYLGDQTIACDVSGFRQNLLDSPAVETIAERITREIEALHAGK